MLEKEVKKMEGKHPEAEETLKPYSPEEGPPLPKGIFPPWPTNFLGREEA